MLFRSGPVGVVVRSGCVCVWELFRGILIAVVVDVLSFMGVWRFGV